jgi:hypothetical protein
MMMPGNEPASSEPSNASRSNQRPVIDAGAAGQRRGVGDVGADHACRRQPRPVYDDCPDCVPTLIIAPHSGWRSWSSTAAITRL